LLTLSQEKILNHRKNYSGPYHGYDGFAIFARDMDMALNSPTWALIDAPWKKKEVAAAKAA
jgi:nitrogenase molybdenum-iron protein alpha/beta subunit